MKTQVSKVTSKGQIVIPRKLRERYGIHTSTEIRWVERQEGILMVPLTEDPITAARGMLKGTGILKAYQREKRAEKRKESNRLAKFK
jgi:AbrB family looped-hinge helix DNA binding protein